MECSIHQSLGGSRHLLGKEHQDAIRERSSFAHLIEQQQLQHPQARRSSQACISVQEAPQAALQPGKNTNRAMKI